MDESKSRLTVEVAEGTKYTSVDGRVLCNNNYVSSIGEKYNKVFNDTKAAVIGAKKNYIGSNTLGTVSEDVDYETR